MIATGVGTCMAQEIPASYSVDWGGGYIRFVRDPLAVTAATSAKLPARPATPTVTERAIDWGGGYIRYVTDPAGVTKAIAGAGDKN
jgi:hypothetical protein